MTFDQAMEKWSFLEGEWTVHRPDGTTTELTCTKGANASCYLLRTDAFHGIVTYDGAEKTMMIFGSHPEGTHSLAHWVFESAKIIEGGFTVTSADGSTKKHTGRFEIMGEDEFTYAIDGEQYARYMRNKDESDRPAKEQ